MRCRLAAFLGLLALAGGFACACEAPRARPAQVPPASTRVVRVDPAAPAGSCEDGDEGDEPAQWLAEDLPEPRPGVAYVKMSEWTPPPSVQALEAVVPPRGDVPPTYIQFPKLTKHSSIGAMHSRRH